MGKEKVLKLLGIGIVLVILQSYFQHYDTFIPIYKKYIGYLVPIIYAFFITIFLEPIVFYIERKLEIRRRSAVFLTVLLVIFIFILAVAIVIPQIVKSIEELYSKLPFMQEQIEKYATLTIEFLKSKGLITVGSDEIYQSINGFFRDNLKYVQDFGIGVLWNIVWWSIALTKFFIGFFLAILILLDKEYFINFLKNIFKIIFGTQRAIDLLEFLEKSRKILMNYLWGRLIVSLAVGLITFFVMLVSGTPYAILSGLMIGVGNMIPYVGSIIAGLVSIFLVALASPYKLIFLAIAIGIAQFVDGWVIGPMILSRSVGMNSFWIIVSVLIGGSLYGPIGMFFGVPVFGMIKLIYQELLRKEEKRNKIEYDKGDKYI